MAYVAAASAAAIGAAIEQEAGRILTCAVRFRMNG